MTATFLKPRSFAILHNLGIFPDPPTPHPKKLPWISFPNCLAISGYKRTSSCPSTRIIPSSWKKNSRASNPQVCGLYKLPLANLEIKLFDLSDSWKILVPSLVEITLAKVAPFDKAQISVKYGECVEIIICLSLEYSINNLLSLFYNDGCKDYSGSSIIIISPGLES